MTYSRLSLGVTLFSLLAGAQACAPVTANKSAAADPSDQPVASSSVRTPTTAAAAADACPAIEPMLHRDLTSIMEHHGRLVASNKSLAASLSGLYGLEQTFKRSSTELASYKFTNAENTKDAAVGVKELDQVRTSLSETRVKIEDLVRKAATPLRQAREKAWEMRTVCEGAKGGKPSTDCRAIVKAFPDSELSTWMSHDVTEQAIAKIDKMKIKDVSFASDLANVRSKLAAASSANDEMMALETGDNAKDEVSAHTKAGIEAIERITKRCGDTKLAPVDWIPAAAGTDPRKLTVLVVGVLPEPMRKIFDESGTSKGDLTSGSTGSGVVVVRKINNEKKVFVVTNRHVVDHALRTKILIDGSPKFIDANVAYVDPHHDLAILEVIPGADGTLPFEAGVTLETAPAADQQTVVAAGFPGMGDRPSYQVTRGYISNRKLSLGDGQVTPYIQHTAPTDSGSSGGPLLSEGGRLMGINTLKMRGREGVSISIPARLVVEALHSIEAQQTSAVKDDARFACLKMIADLGATKLPTHASRRLSAGFVADVGPAAYQRSLKRLSKDEVATASVIYARDPLGMLNWASLNRLQESITASGGVSELELCEGVTMGAATASSPTNARFLIQTVRGPRELKLVRERGDWAVASFDFRDNGGVVLPPSSKGSAKNLVAAGKASSSSSGAIQASNKRAKDRKAVQSN